MANRKIMICMSDLDRLNGLIESSPVGSRECDPAHRTLADEILRARIVADNALPDDAIALDTRVCIRDEKTHESEVYQIVLPQKASFEDGRISVTSPIGIALIGYRLGDRVAWDVPGGRRSWRIESVEQTAVCVEDDSGRVDAVHTGGAA